MTATEPCDCGTKTCDFAKADEPCYGSISAVDEVEVETSDGPDWQWVHACEGHKHVSWGDKYEPKEQP
jgi:hypothetical protein